MPRELQQRRSRLLMLPLLGLCLASFALRCDARAVNVSNTWTMPQEGLNVFYRFFRDRISWFEADAVCQFHHANLVTVDNSFQFDATRDLLRELDVNDIVWIGLMRPQNSDRFMWSNSRPLVADTGYWAESLPLMDAPLCAVIDPIRDYRWHALRCGGPETASFLCEMPVPSWADACILKEMPNLTMQYMADTASIELIRNCQEEGLLRHTCKGKEDRERAIRQLICPKERLEAQRINDITNSHFKSLQIINNMPTDNNENNDIELLPLMANYGASAIKIEVATVATSAPPLPVERFSLDSLMMADAPAPHSGFDIPDEIPMPVKKSAKKVNPNDEYAKKQLVLRKTTPKPSVSHLDMMMGDQPPMSDEQLTEDRESDVSNEIFEALPHRKKILMEDLKTMQPITEAATEEVTPTTTAPVKSTNAPATTTESPTTTTTAAAAASTTTVAATTTTTQAVPTTTTAATTTTTMAATTTPATSTTTTTTQAPATTAARAAAIVASSSAAPATTTTITTTSAPSTTTTTTTTRPTTEMNIKITTATSAAAAVVATATATSATSATEVKTDSDTTVVAATTGNTSNNNNNNNNDDDSSNIPTPTTAAMPMGTSTVSIAHPIHPVQQTRDEMPPHPQHVKETVDNSHFIPPMLLVKSHYVPPAKHGEHGEHWEHLEHGEHKAATTTTAGAGVQVEAGAGPLNRLIATTASAATETTVDKVAAATSTTAPPPPPPTTTATNKALTTEAPQQQQLFEATATKQPTANATAATVVVAATAKMNQQQQQLGQESESESEDEDEKQQQQLELTSATTARHNFLQEETEAPFKPNRRRSLTKPETVSYFKKILG